MSDEPPPSDADLLDAILSVLPTGLIVTDRRGVVKLANKAATAMLAHEATDPTGRTLASIRGELDAMLWPTDRGEILLLPEGRRSDEEPRVLGFTSRDLTDAQGERTGTVIVLSDISADVARKRRTAHRRRLADIGGVVATVAHEIRNPLFAITALARLLRDEVGPRASGDAHVMLDKIGAEAARISRLVDDLLGFARDRELELEAVDLVALVQTVLDDLRTNLARAADGEPEVVVELAVASRLGGMLEWRLDREAVRQVLSNLVRNAIQAVRAHGDGVTGPGVIVRLDTWDDWVEVEIEDHGVGIPPETLPRIFDPFFTSRKRGTGLGLAVVDRLVRQHRGTISVGSKLGTGTTVTVRLPP
jgi:signal transduction histidine kinase